MNAATLSNRSTSLADAENWFALGTGALLLLVGAVGIGEPAEYARVPLTHVGPLRCLPR
jgi:hypothetical protein